MLFPTIQTIRITFINNILRRIPPPALPEFTSVKSFCDHFSKYFVHKIEIIRSKFTHKVLNIAAVQKNEIESKMKDFECATEDEIRKPFLGSSSKSYDLNSIPTRVLQNCLNIPITIITYTISIETSTFPQNSTYKNIIYYIAIYLIHHNLPTGNIIL